MRIVALLLLAFTLPARAELTPDDFAWGIPLTIDGSKPAWQLPVPEAVYAGVTRGDLRDLRVFNAAGEIVPSRIVGQPTLTEREALQAELPRFPVPVAESGEDWSLRFTTGPDGTLLRIDPGEPAPAPRRWLLDASAADWQPRELELRFSGEGVHGLRVEVSNDLRRWRAAQEAELLKLRMGGRELLHDRIPLPAGDWRYLRLELLTPETSFTLTGARLHGDRQRQAPPQPVWRQLEPTTAADDAPGRYPFDTGLRAPLTRLEVALPQTNTVAEAQLLSRDRPEDRWLPAGGGLLWRLQLDGRPLQNPPLVVRPLRSRYLALDFADEAAGIGAGALGLRVGWVPELLQFVARGEGPFLLAFGYGGALPRAATTAWLPDLDTGDAQLIGQATAGARQELGGPAQLTAPAPVPAGRPWLAWLALAAGLGLLGWMAWRLYRELERR